MQLFKKLLAGLAGSLLLLGGQAAADTWPEKPITLIVPYPAGGGADTIGRLVGERLALELDQPVVINNVPGAGTLVGARALLQAQPDGYTLMLAPNNQLTMLPHLNSNADFDPNADFAYITKVASIYYFIAVPEESPIQSLSQLIDQLKADPGGLTYSSCGPGSGCNVAGEFFKSLTDTDMLHVPYAGSAAAITALLGSHVDVAVDTAAALTSQIQAGRVRALAIAEAERWSVLPDVPTAVEQGVDDFLFANWQGLVAPAGTPQHVIERVNAAWHNIAEAPQTAGDFSSRALGLMYSTPEEFAEDVRHDLVKWGEVIKNAGITLQ